MQTKPKSNSVVTTSYADGCWLFQVAGEGTLTLHRERVAAEVLERAMVEGMSDRIADAAAKSRDPITGKPATPAEKRASMAALVDHYESGTTDWSRRGTGDRGDVGMLFEALTIMQPTADVRAFLATLTDDDKRALVTQDEGVMSAIAAIKRKRAASANVDTKSILSRLNAKFAL